MGKTIGQSMLSKQETTHFFSLPMISCSHMLTLINLDGNQNLISMPTATNETANGVTGNGTSEDNSPGNNTSANSTEVNVIANNGISSATVKKKTIVETHGLSMEKKHCLMMAYAIIMCQG